MYNNIFVTYNIYDDEMGKSAWEIFLLGGANLMGSVLTIWTFFKAKNNIVQILNIN